MQISILLHPMSLKIIEHEYHDKIADGVLGLSSGDHLLHQLYYSNKSTTRNRHRKDIPLHCLIEIQVPEYAFVNGDSSNYILKHVGEYLYREHIQMMLSHVVSELPHTGNVMKSLRNFFDRYGIDEYDLSMDTAYKNWQRYEKKAIKKTKKHIQKIRVEYGVKLISYEDVHKLAGRIVCNDYHLFINSRGDFNQRLFRKMLFHLLTTKALWKINQIADVFKYKSVEHIYNRINDFNLYLMKNRRFQQRYSRACTNFELD